MTTRGKRIGVGVALLATLGFFAFSLRSDVVLNVQGTSTGILLGVAELELVNRSRHPIIYGARSEDEVEYTVLYQTEHGWEPERGFRCGTGVERYQLQPGARAQFQVLFDETRPCKVRVYYRAPNATRRPSYLRSLPRWADPVVDFVYRSPRITSETITVE